MKNVFLALILCVLSGCASSNMAYSSQDDNTAKQGAIMGDNAVGAATASSIDKLL